MTEYKDIKENLSRLTRQRVCVFAAAIKTQRLSLYVLQLFFSFSFVPRGLVESTN